MQISVNNDILAKCYINSPDAACARGVQSIAFPNIRTGSYNYPKALASQTGVRTDTEYVRVHASGGLPLKRIEFICYDKENAD